MRTKLTLTAAFVALTFGQAAFAANQNLSTDVLVVGAGSAGLTAAVQAAEKGKKVILLEKNLGVEAVLNLLKACSRSVPNGTA